MGKRFLLLGITFIGDIVVFMSEAFNKLAADGSHTPNAIIFKQVCHVPYVIGGCALITVLGITMSIADSPSSNEKKVESKPKNK